MTITNRVGMARNLTPAEVDENFADHTTRLDDLDTRLADLATRLAALEAGVAARVGFTGNASPLPA